MNDTISPHGGKLVNRILEGEKRQEAQKKAENLKSIKVSPRIVSDIELIAVGALSPIEGFMGKEDYDSVVGDMRLSNGLPWTIPVTLPVSVEVADEIEEGQEISILDQKGNLIAMLNLEERFFYDKESEAKNVYRTTDSAHPGVSVLNSQGDVLLGGEINLVNRPTDVEFPNYRLEPAQTREIFKKKGWRRVVAFQTRNPIHRAHEYLQKCALEMVDGLLIHPIVGETKSDDIPAHLRIRCYEELLENYYPEDRSLLSVLPAAMRYAGPREAIFHAIVRKNYGCTHFIVGRDHAGVGNYYGTYDAHKIFDEFSSEEIEITPLFFDHAFYCKRCNGMATKKTCACPPENHVHLSGTKVREMLKNKQQLPKEFTRPEVAKILMEAYSN
ncbi:sulfate adenylyltransferase [Desulfobacterota bacterium AH_259_B03_O07]|nr:sulfate adenylyltransferase [Desulfobacterota bacterium AH_259_B03_O07]